MMLVALSRNVPALLDDAARNRKNLIRDRAAHGLAPATVLRGEDTTKVSKLSGSAEEPRNLGFPGMLSVRMADGSAD